MTPLPQPTSAKERVPSRTTHLIGGAFYFFIAIGALALGYAGLFSADAHLFQVAETRELDRPKPSVSQNPRPLADGELLGEIQVPRLGLDAIVVQGDSPRNLRRAVAHLANSALPGEQGNVALAGHRDTFFRPLRDIQVGDQILFKTHERRFEYVVQSIEIVGPREIRVLDPSTEHDLTLLTCYPFHYVGPAPKRFIVHAREVQAPH
jgi:sortase A